LSFAPDGGEQSISHPDRFTLGKIVPGTYWIGDWVDPTAGLDAMENSKFSGVPLNYSDAEQIKHL
jgi:hypothetical protein